jgi:hypothetical protein
VSFTIEEMNEGNLAIVADGEALLRKPVSLGNWTRRRFGMWTHFPVTAATLFGSTPRLYMGFCNAAGGGPGSATCGHFVGIRSNASSWTYSSGTGAAYLHTSSTAANLQRVIIVGGTPTTADYTVFGSWNHGAVHSSTAEGYRLFTILEAVRTSATQLTLSALYTRFDNPSNIAADITAMSNDWLLGVMQSSEALSVFADDLSVNTVAVSNGPFTIDENANGVLDAVAFSMDGAERLLAGRILVASEA